MLLNHVVLALLWIVYCVLHSALASLRVKGWLQQKLGGNYRYYRLFYTVFAAITLAVLIGYQFTLSSPRLFETALLSNILGGFVAFAGLFLMAICIRKYFLSLSGLKSLFQERPASELMISGVHRYMRHPLYSGTFLFIWGLWILFPTAGLLIADAVITAYTTYAIRLEEDKLVREFGETYRRYQQKVPKLIPRL